MGGHLWLTSHLRSGGENEEYQGPCRPLEISARQQLSWWSHRAWLEALLPHGPLHHGQPLTDPPSTQGGRLSSLGFCSHTCCSCYSLPLHSWHESKASHRYKNARCQAVKWSHSSVLPQVRHFYVTISWWHFDVSFWAHSSVSKWTSEHVKPIVLS